MNNFISVVITTFNGQDYLLQQLTSILNQTLRPNEVIICDDNSTDNTIEIVQKFISKNKLESSWHLYKNMGENLGYIKNFKKGLSIATGTYIFLADQDDIWYQNKLELMIYEMKKNNKIELLMSNVSPLYMSKDANRVNFKSFGKKRLVKINFSGEWINTPRPGCTFCIRRSLLDEYLKNVNYKIPHDNSIWQISNIRNTSYLLNIPLMEYRRHANNASNNKKNSKNKRLDAIQTQIYEIDNMLSSNILNNSQRKFIIQQKLIFKKRKKYIKQSNAFGISILIFKLKYYPYYRFWLTDIYYAIK